MIINNRKDYSQRGTLFIPYSGGLDSKTILEMYKNFDLDLMDYSSYKCLNLFSFLAFSDSQFGAGPHDLKYFKSYIKSSQFLKDFIPLVFMYVNPNDFNKDENILDIFKKSLRVSYYGPYNYQYLKNRSLKDIDGNLWRFVFAKSMSCYIEYNDDILYGITACDVVNDLSDMIDILNYSFKLGPSNNDNIKLDGDVRILTPLREYSKLSIYHLLRSANSTIKLKDINVGCKFSNVKNLSNRNITDYNKILVTLKHNRLLKVDKEYELIKDKEIDFKTFSELNISIDNFVDNHRLNKTKNLLKYDYYNKMKKVRNCLYIGKLKEAYNRMVDLHNNQDININMVSILENLNKWYNLFDGKDIDLSGVKAYLKDAMNVK